MASTNTPAVFWNVGDTDGKDNAGATVDIPTLFQVSTATTAPTATPTTALPLYLAVDDIYLWDGSAWVGPYSVAT